MRKNRSVSRRRKRSVNGRRRKRQQLQQKLPRMPRARHLQRRLLLRKRLPK